MRILSIATTIIIMVPSYQIGTVLQGPIEIEIFTYFMACISWTNILGAWMSITCASSYNTLIQ